MNLIIRVDSTNPEIAGNSIQTFYGQDTLEMTSIPLLTNTSSLTNILLPLIPLVIRDIVAV